MMFSSDYELCPCEVGTNVSIPILQMVKLRVTPLGKEDADWALYDFESS